MRNQLIDTLSKGYKHRTCFAQSVIHDPIVLILDEPTDGLDPNQKHEVRALIRRMGEEKAIIFSTHILEEVEAACTRAMIIDQGRVVADGTPSDLRKRDDEAGSVEVDIQGALGGEIKSGLSGLSTVSRVDEIKSGDTGLVARVYPRKGNSTGEAIYNLCKEKGYVLNELNVEIGRLDNVFRKITTTETTSSVAQSDQGEGAKVA